MSQPEIEWTQDELDDAISYMDESMQLSGAFFYPEQHQRLAFDTSMMLAKATLLLVGTKGDEGLAYKFDQPIKTEYEKLADASQKAALSLFWKIPRKAFLQLERENRSQSESKATQNIESTPMPEKARLLNIFLENPDEPISYLDMGGRLFPDDDSPNLYNRTVRAFYEHRTYVEKELLARGRTLSQTRVIGIHQSRRKVLAFTNRSIEQVSEDAKNDQIEYTWTRHAGELDNAAHIQRSLADYAMTRWYRAEREMTTVYKYEWRAEVWEMTADLRNRDDVEQREIQRKKRDELAAEAAESLLMIPRFLVATKTLGAPCVDGKTYLQESQVDESLAEQSHAIYPSHETKPTRIISPDRLDQDGYPIGFIDEIEKLEARLKNPPPHDEIAAYLKER